MKNSIKKIIFATCLVSMLVMSGCSDEATTVADGSQSTETSQATAADENVPQQNQSGRNEMATDGIVGVVSTVTGDQLTIQLAEMAQQGGTRGETTEGQQGDRQTGDKAATEGAAVQQGGQQQGGGQQGGMPAGDLPAGDLPEGTAPQQGGQQQGGMPVGELPEGTAQQGGQQQGGQQGGMMEAPALTGETVTYDLAENLVVTQLDTTGDISLIAADQLVMLTFDENGSVTTINILG